MQNFGQLGLKNYVCFCMYFHCFFLFFFFTHDLIYRYGKGKFNEGVDLGSEVPWDPRGQKC